MNTEFIRENKPVDVSPSSQAWFTDKLNQALDEYDTLKDSHDRLKETLERIQNWQKAYPLKVFPALTKDNWKQAAEVLKANGLSLDRISADNMRHVLNGIKGIVEQALADEEQIK